MKNRVAYFGVFVALALIFSYVETMIPFQIGIPGVKLGLANLIVGCKGGVAVISNKSGFIRIYIW